MGGGKATASMVLGILALTIGWCSMIIAVPMAITGLILGIVDRRGANRGYAKAGIIMCSISLGLHVLIVVVVIVLAATGKLK